MANERLSNGEGVVVNVGVPDRVPDGEVQDYVLNKGLRQLREWVRSSSPGMVLSEVDATVRLVDAENRDYEVHGNVWVNECVICGEPLGPRSYALRDSNRRRAHGPCAELHSARVDYGYPDAKDMGEIKARYRADASRQQ